MARKSKEAPTLKFYVEAGNSSLQDCSGCTKPIIQDSVLIVGNLVGSGVKPFLYLCPTCQTALTKWFTDRQIQQMAENTMKHLRTHNESTVDSTA